MALNAIPTENALQTTLGGTLSAGETGSLTLADDYSTQLADVSASRPAILVVNHIDSDGVSTPSKREYIKFTSVSTTTLSTLTRGMGGSSAQSHEAGAIVEFVLDADTVKSITDTILVEHEADGTHSAGAIDAIGEIDSGLRSGSDTTLVTGTAGTTDYTAKWNADGDLVDGYEVKDEDDMSSDSATALATQQSIKAYVDNNSSSTTVKVNNDGSNSTISSPIIASGWKDLEGNDTSQVTDTLSFGTTFSAAPVVIVAPIGGKSGGAAASIGALNVGVHMDVTAYSIGTGGCSVIIRRDDGGNFTSGSFYGYSWIAIGS